MATLVERVGMEESVGWVERRRKNKEGVRQRKSEEMRRRCKMDEWERQKERRRKIQDKRG